MDTTSAIAIRGLSKRFANRVVLRDITLDVPSGTVVGLLGLNGAGKTTLLEILSTLLVPTAGDAFIQGLHVVRDAGAVKQLLGYCPCGFDSFYARLSAVANLEFFAALKGLGRRQGRVSVESALAAVAVDGSRDLAFQRLSSGMKQRVALARALISDPPILLLDEPTRSLDLQGQREIWALMGGSLVGRLHKTVLFVTHNLAETQVCDWVAILHQGRIIDITVPASLTRARLTEMFRDQHAGTEQDDVPEAREGVAG